MSSVPSSDRRHARPLARAAAAALLVAAIGVGVAGCAPKMIAAEYTAHPADHMHRDISQVWVQPFKTPSGRSAALGEQVAAAVRGSIGSEQQIQVREDPNGYVIGGRINQVNVSDPQIDRSEFKDKEGNVYVSYNASKSASLSGNYELWRGGEMICAKNLAASTGTKASGDSAAAAVAGLASDEQLVQAMVRDIAEAVKHGAVPHKKFDQLQIVNIKHPAGKQAMMHLQHGEPADARSLYQQAIDHEQTVAKPNPKEKAKSLYMMGVTFEKEGNLAEADKFYDQARMADPMTALYMTSRKRVREAPDGRQMRAAQ